MKRSDFTYAYSADGYMLKYHGKNLGGAGTLPRDKPRHWKHSRANLIMYREDAEREIMAILNGNGQKRFLDIIRSIDNEERKEKAS